MDNIKLVMMTVSRDCTMTLYVHAPSPVKDTKKTTLKGAADTCERHQEDDAERGRGQKQCLLVFAFQMTLEDHTGNVVLRDQLLTTE